MEHATERLFEIMGQDAQGWREHAELLKMSAVVILPELQRVLPLPQTMREMREKKLSYARSYMLLIAFAFENLMKGIIIGRDPALVKPEKIENKLLRHGLVELANWITIPDLSEGESCLLRRLTEYAVWGGRYRIPTRSAALFGIRDLLSFRDSDPMLINQLFNRLAEILQNEWEDRQGSASAVEEGGGLEKGGTLCP